jgi:RIO-like serine/threonine protein kinase
MNYYKYGSICDYKWNVNNFDILQNVVRQAVYASLYAFTEINFIHGDFHPFNVLLKPKNTN